MFSFVLTTVRLELITSHRFSDGVSRHRKRYDVANNETPFSVSHFLNVVLKTNISADRKKFVTISLVVYIPMTWNRKAKFYRGFGKKRLLTSFILMLCYTGIRNLHFYTTNLHCYTTSLHCYTNLHCYTTNFNCYSTNFHCYTTNLYCCTTNLTVLSYFILT